MSAAMIAKETFELFERSYNWHKPIRSVTVTAIDLIEESTPCQLDLFCNAQRLDKLERLDAAVDRIRERFGRDAVRNAVLFQDIKMSGKINKVRMPTGTVTLLGGI